MRIAIATPLYPPDTAPTARYAKDLAERLSKDHTVTVLAYTYLPESVPGVSMAKVHKRSPLPLRLLSFTRALMRAMREHDRVLLINGASTELPFVFGSLFFQTHTTLLLRDTDASTSGIRSILRRLASNRASQVVSVFPPLRPEILPLEPFPAAAVDAYEAAWQEHRTELSV